MKRTFVGRDRELAELLAGLHDAVAGRGRLLLIEGAPGIGKTALAEQLADHAAEQQARMLWGRCWEAGGAPPYWPWIQIIETLAAGYDDGTLVSFFGLGAQHLAGLSPALAERLGEALVPSSSSSSDAARFYLFEALARFFRNASEVEPLVFVLDDLHAADPASLLLLRFLARDVRASRVLVVGAYRDLNVERSPDVADLVGELIREGDLLSLRGLDRDDVADLVKAVSGAVPRVGVVKAIHGATEGNPLFVREVVRLLAQDEALDLPDDLRVPIPASVRAVIRRRLVPLSAGAVQVLSAAAVVGRDFDLSLVRPACDLPVDRILNALSEAVALGVVVEVSRTLGTYRFHHALVRDVIYEELPTPARMQLHQRVGEAIERQHGPDSGSHFAELANHFAMCLPVGAGDKAYEYALKAGDKAMGTQAYEEASRQYRHALQALRSVGRNGDLCCELLLKLGEAQARAGDYREAKQTYLEAAELARKLGSPEQLAQAALGYGEPQVEGSLVNRQLIALLHEALEALSHDDRSLRARLLARLSVEHTFSGETRLRDSLSQEALDMARRLGEVASLGVALRARWLALWGPEAFEERLAVAEELLWLAGHVGDQEMELLARARRAAGSLERGDIRSVETDVAAHTRLADELRMPAHQWSAATMRAMLALLHGLHDEAISLADHALSIQPGRATPQFAHLYQVALTRWEQGRLEEMRQAWHQLVAQFPHVILARAWLALAEAESAQPNEAGTHLRAVVEGIPTASRDGLWLPALATASLAAARLPDLDAAAVLYTALLPYQARTITFGVPQPVICLGAASLYLGLLATAMSKWEEAKEHFESALNAHKGIGATAHLGRAQYEYARMLTLRGHATERSQAIDLLDRSLETSRAIGMTRVSKDAEELREFVTGKTVAAEPATDAIAPELRGEYIFRREADYWTICYEGSLARLRDSKGLRYLARLLATPGREIHAVDIETMTSTSAGPTQAKPAANVPTAEFRTRADIGDAGVLLDEQAKATYKARLDDLQAELDEAESFNDPARATRAKEERAWLVDELARAVGLGGRDRRAASHAERARLNVTRAIRAAITNLGRANPSLGQHLSTTIRTGQYCSYTPDPRAPIAWHL